jgi:hypothetical protein
MNGTRLTAVPILLVVVVALVTGLLTGLLRIGWTMPPVVAERIGLHGPLLAAGFLGTLIALERAVAMSGVTGRRWGPAWLAPLAGAAGTAALLIWGATPVAQSLLLAGAAGLLAVNLVMLRMHPTLDVLVMALGAGFLVLADAAWLAGRPIPLLVHWWMAFLVLTIVGERIELARMRILDRTAVALFAIVVGGYVISQLLIAVGADLGIRLSGAGMIAMAAWLLRYDIAWLTIRRPGLPAFVATCLLAGFGWLAVGGAIALASGLVWAGPTYDALLHAVLVGFVFSMILGHAPIIVPALLGLRIGYHPIAYAPLVLLQLSVAMRIAGDLRGAQDLRMMGGLLAALAILGYAVVLVVMVALGRRGRRVVTRGA